MIATELGGFPLSAYEPEGSVEKIKRLKKSEPDTERAENADLTRLASPRKLRASASRRRKTRLRSLGEPR